ncbi:MAG: ABC transporter permease [Nitrososphaerota archaeon]|nr:ABC transporter permease [Nitrososphaerota archaeon]MDG6955295.1 ABC transporter permease [Nitrososphaerota archaeon]
MITRRWVLRRLVLLTGTFVAALLIDFTLPRLMPGNPVQTEVTNLIAAGFTLSPEAIKGMYALYGYNPNLPIYVQFYDYIVQLLHGNLGVSYIFFPQSVSYLIAQRLPWTIFLVSIAVAVSWIPGTFIGMFAAGKRNAKFDSIFTPLLNFISSIPNFWLGFLFLIFFAADLKIFPLFGAYSNTVTPGANLAFILSVLHHAILPILSLAIVAMGGYVIHMRNTMVGVMGDDFVLVARAKGLSNRRIVRTYAGANALLPNITMLAISMGAVFGGNILVETIFTYPGIGYLSAVAVSGEDYSLILGIFLIFTIAILVANLMADLLYAWLDPRVSLI